MEIFVCRCIPFSSFSYHCQNQVSKFGLYYTLWTQNFALVCQGFSVSFEEIVLFHPFYRNTFSGFTAIVTASNYSLIYEGSIVRTFSSTAVNTLCKISIISVFMCPASKPVASEFNNYFWLLFFKS